jgi:hypothetical protein
MVEKKTETDNPEYVPVETRMEKKTTTTEKVVSPGPTDLEREEIMSTATPEAEAARKAMLAKETTTTKEAMRTEPMIGAAATRTETEAERERRMRTGAAMTGAAMATGAAASRSSPEAGERTTRQGAAIGTEPTRITPERPVTGTVVPPGTERVTPMKPYGTLDERARMHAEDPSVHPDWETQPQINAPQDVGIPTAEGQADAARLRAGGRRSDTAKEPRVDRRGGEYDVPLASGARTPTDTTTKPMGTDNRTMTEKAKDEAHKVKEETKMKATEVKEDVDRKI